MKKLLFVIALTGALTACGSSVKLDDVPVEDKSGKPVAGAGAGSSGSANPVGNSAVASVNIDKSADGAGALGARMVYFDYDSYIVKPEYQAVVDAQARYLKADKSRKSMIEGHTDERGGREYNLALGQKRSEAVRQALALLGVAESQMEAVSYGKEKPAAAGADETAFSKNRRAEIVYR